MLLPTMTILLFAILLVLFFGYPALVYILSNLKGRRIPIAKYLPSVSIVVPCYNSREHVDVKVSDLLSLDYPKEKLQVIFVDSGSIDGTAEALREYERAGSIKLVSQEARLGKPAAINAGLRVAEGEIVVLTDVDAKVEADALRNLAKSFADPDVGAAVGNVALKSGRSLISRMNSFFYQFFRERVRRWESSIDSASFFSGELMAFRKDLLGEVDDDAVSDDFHILLKLRKRGYRCVSAGQAFVSEMDVETVSGQISHKRRTIAGSLQVFSRDRDAFFNRKLGLFGLLIFPAYFARMIIAPIILLALEVLVILQLLFWNTFSWLLVWVGLLLIALFVFSLISNRLRGFILGLLYAFVVQVATLLGIVDYLTGNYSVLWKRKGR